MNKPIWHTSEETPDCSTHILYYRPHGYAYPKIELAYKSRGGEQYVESGKWNERVGTWAYLADFLEVEGKLKRVETMFAKWYMSGKLSDEDLERIKEVLDG